MIQETNARWLAIEREAEAAHAAETKADAASAKQLREATSQAKRVNKAQRRRESDKPHGTDDIISLVIVALILLALIVGAMP